MGTIFDELRLDHDSHRRLLDGLVETSGDSPERRELWKRVRGELVAHARAEERVFYARLLAEPVSQGQATHGVHEHEQMNDRLEQLGELELSSPAWLPALRGLREFVLHHESEEETSVFPVAGRVLSDGEKQALADAFRSARQAEAVG